MNLDEDEGGWGGGSQLLRQHLQERGRASALTETDLCGPREGLECPPALMSQPTDDLRDISSRGRGIEQTKGRCSLMLRGGPGTRVGKQQQRRRGTLGFARARNPTLLPTQDVPPCEAKRRKMLPIG